MNGVNPQRTGYVPAIVLICTRQCWELGSSPQRVLKCKETEKDSPRPVCSRDVGRTLPGAIRTYVRGIFRLGFEESV